jgi:hypothetical protein
MYQNPDFVNKEDFPHHLLTFLSSFHYVRIQHSYPPKDAVTRHHLGSREHPSPDSQTVYQLLDLGLSSF